MNKLSKREKILLYILLISALLFFGLQYMLLPLSAANTALRDELSEYEMKTQLELQRGLMLPVMQDELGKLSGELSAKKVKLADYMVNDDIDKMITGLALSCDLRPVSLNMPEGVLPITTGTSGGESSPDEEPETLLGSDLESGTVNSPALPPAYMSTVHFVATGTYANMLRFIDAIDGSPYLAASQIAFDLGKSESPTLSVTLMLFMAVK